MPQALKNIAVNTAAVRYGAVLCVFALLSLEPALANKFETIGGGVSGSSAIKREWLQKFFLICGGLSLLGSILVVAIPHTNAAFLNFSNWRQSAIVLFVFSSGFFLAAALL